MDFYRIKNGHGSEIWNDSVQYRELCQKGLYGFRRIFPCGLERFQPLRQLFHGGTFFIGGRTKLFVRFDEVVKVIDRVSD